MEVCNRSDRSLLKGRRLSLAANPSVGASGHGVAVILRNTVQAAALGVLVGFTALPTARADEPAPSFKPAISDEAATAVLQMGKTLLAGDLTITARTIRVYQDESGQPLHIFHTMRIAARRPDRIAVEFTGDDGKRNLFYDGKAASVFFPDSKKYMMIPAAGDIPSALDEVANKLDLDFPLSALFANSPDKVLLGDAMAAWQVGTADVDGVECRHLFFSQKSGVDLELWVEKNGAATPHRLIVTYRLLPGQPSFIAEFTSWKTQPPLSDAEFAFRVPADAKKIELTPAVVSERKGASDDLFETDLCRSSRNNSRNIGRCLWPIWSAARRTAASADRWAAASIGGPSRPPADARAEPSAGKPADPCTKCRGRKGAIGGRAWPRKE